MAKAKSIEWNTVLKNTGRDMPEFLRGKVRVCRTSGSAYVVIGKDYVLGQRLNFLFDGSARIGLVFCAEGEFRFKPQPTRSRLVLPRSILDVVPVGTDRLFTLQRDGDVLFFDLNEEPLA